MFERSMLPCFQISRTGALKRICAAVLALLFASSVAAYAQTVRSSSGPNLLLDIKGAIGVGVELQIAEALAAAKSQQAELIIIRLDTPGGLVSSTREIIGGILNSAVPVVVYVAPSGARAASAGTYISYAAHVAGMAPGTHLGAATPIQMGGLPGLPGGPSSDHPSKDGDDKSKRAPASSMQKKVLNDAVAYIRTLAQLRGRNADWAEKAVSEAATLTAGEALKEHVIDLVAQDIPDLLAQLDGRQVKTIDGERRLKTAGTTFTVFEPSLKSRILAVVTDPNVAFILLMIGFYGILFEFWSPGLAGPGVVGALCLIIALTALSAMPVTAGGLALLLLGMALMVAEAFAPGFGILGLGGLAAFIAGGLFLFDPSAADIDLSVSRPVLIGAAATTALFFAGLLGMVVRSRQRAVRTGAEELLGSRARVVSWEGSSGRVRILGEIWAANSQSPVKPGDEVRVTSRNGMTLEVVPEL